MLRSRGWLGLAAGFLGWGGAIALPSIGLAQTTPRIPVADGTLGAESSQVIQNYNGLPVEAIFGGAQRGQNLFHSFREFNVDVGRGAYFAIPNDVVRNVLARVTGGNRSEILGTLGTFRPSDGALRVPGVNLFLINPKGILFGQNASLDVGGSFFATTANAVQLGEAGLFSASQPASSNLLSVNPSAFLFNAISNQNQSEIVVRSRATQTVLEELTYGLRVPNLQNLLLLGGNVNIDGGLLNAYGGRVELGAVAGLGVVGLNADESLQFQDGTQRANVSLTNAAQVDVKLANSGSVSVTAHNLDVVDGSAIFAGIFSGLGSVTSHAGNITLNATGTIKFSNRSGVSNEVDENATGNGGSIELTAQFILLSNGSQLIAGTSGKGNAGNVKITATGNVSFTGNSSGILNSVNAGAIGNGGDIEVTTRDLSVTSGAALTSRSFGQGNAGSIYLNIRDLLQVDDGTISTAAWSSGGAIKITARHIRLFGNSDVTTFVGSGAGGGGNITLNAVSIIALADSDILAFAPDGRGGDVTLNAPIFLGQNYSPARSATDPRTVVGNDLVNIYSSGASSISSSNTFIQNSLTQLSQVPIDTGALLANSCIVRRNQPNGSFFITGPGGLPERPGTAASPVFPTGEVQNVEQPKVRSQEPRVSTQHSYARRPWKIGDPIVEPQGVYQLPDGQLVLSHECR